MRTYLGSREARKLTAEQREELEKKLRGATVVETWRLPENMIDDLGPDGVREMLAKWFADGAPMVTPDPPQSSRTSSWAIAPEIVNALCEHAQTASEHTDRRWTNAQIVRRIYELYPQYRPEPQEEEPAA